MDGPGPGLGEVARQWTRIGVLGFGGPPAHVNMLRRLCVDRRGWIDSRGFEDAIAATNPSCRARPRPSWRCTADGGSVGGRARSWEGSASSPPAWC